MFKNDFFSVLCLVDKNFPIHLWCRLLDQAELTLNMLCTSRINPNLSAHEQLLVIHDFNATPLAPAGTKCITHEKSIQHGTWAPHGQHGWYVGAAPEHYRCYQIYIPKHKAQEFVLQWSSSQPTAKCLTCQHMMQPYTQQMT